MAIYSFSSFFLYRLARRWSLVYLFSLLIYNEIKIHTLDIRVLIHVTLLIYNNMEVKYKYTLV